ncbi:protein-export chaperone SecB [Kordiimonas marina]|uniref:protein-export chaperone SecB n=1 Tax=Kordiimonas marina TaxID=2872312 RepID=UPI001FF3C3D2|nr:protein-export chaperone SecB [Kordiimonas marina]MCJ9429823.1 protein-export chaperone SecB [Kordiimonas marina]
MADNEFTTDQTPMGAAPEGAEGPQAGVLAQYIKDLSFENPNAPASLQALSAAKPAIDVNVNVGVRKMNDEVYEVELKISATASHANEDGSESHVAFVVELAYATLFGVRGLPEEALKQFLLIQGPTMMFPFARRIIADASRDGGFPPLLLEPINFEALYQAQAAQEAQQAQAANAAGDSEDPAPISLN